MYISSPVDFTDAFFCLPSIYPSCIHSSCCQPVNIEYFTVKFHNFTLIMSRLL